MIRHYTPKELDDALSKMVVIVDRREQRNEHIIAYLNKNKIPYTERSMRTGDYSFMIDDWSGEYDAVVERKGSIEEIAGNFTADRERFEDEFTRLMAYGTNGHLLIENCSWKDIFSHNYQTKLNPKSLIGSLLGWQARFGITITMCSKEESPKLIHGILYYTARDILIHGSKHG